MTQESNREVRYEVQFNGATLAIYATGQAGLALAALPNFLPNNGYRIIATTFVNDVQTQRRECWPGTGGGITLLAEPEPETSEEEAAAEAREGQYTAWEMIG